MGTKKIFMTSMKELRKELVFNIELLLGFKYIHAC